MKKIIKLRTKIEAGVILCLMIIVSVSSSYGLTLRFGDDPDTPDQDNHFGVLITNQTTNDFIIYGHNETTDNLLLYPNTVDAHFINISGANLTTVNVGDYIVFQDDGTEIMRFIVKNGDATIESDSANTDFCIDSDADIYFREQNNQMFKFVLNGAISEIYGGSDVGDDLKLYGSSNAGTTYGHITIYGDGSIVSEAGNGFSHIFRVNGDQSFKNDVSGSISRFYGGDDAGDDLYIYSNSADSAPSVEIVNATEGYVRVRDLFLVHPRPAAPPRDQCLQGMVYCSSVNGTFFGYTGSGWSAFF